MEGTVLDFGAGRGAWLEDVASPYRRDLRRLQGTAGRVIGVDVDPAVLANPSLDEAHVWNPADPLPLPAASVDLIVADWVLEHLPAPTATVDELARVLRPGGWICARTTNKWGYAGVAARLVPNRLHAHVLTVAQPDRAERDVFPTVYRSNTRAALRRIFDRSRFDLTVWGVNGEPTYCGQSALLWRVARVLFALLPEALSASWFVFARLRRDPPQR